MMNDSQTRREPIEILLIEDEKPDVELMKVSLRHTKTKSSLHVAENGSEALKFLRKKGTYKAAPTPNLILLDLNLPGKKGTDILKEVKKDPKLRKVPVLVMTSSDSEEDIKKSYELHANCYIRKPAGIMEFQKIVNSIESFWFKTVRLPAE